jgi:large subunit ribosomal protein L21e
MSSNKGGTRRKARYKLKKERKDKGKVSISRFMQTLKLDQRVHLKIESSYHKGEFHTQYTGKTGIVCGIRGKCYEIKIKDSNKEKMIIVHPVHLKVLN